MSQKLLQGIPFPYLLQEVEFFHHRFYVNSHVLIPRPETELLVDMIFRAPKRFEKMLDVGVGSGAILLSLVKSEVAKTGMGSDLSPEAINVARINQRRLRLVDRTEFVLSDRFRDIDGKFDLIVSNPPYIKASSHRGLVQDSVDRHEPHLALFLKDDLYEAWFEEFFTGVREHLSSGGMFYFEGHELELENQAKTLASLGFKEVEVRKDFTGLARFLVARA